MPDSIDGSLVVAALSLVVSVLAYWQANKKAEEAKKGLFRCVTRSDALGSLTEGSSLGAPLLASIRDQSCCGLEPTFAFVCFSRRARR